MSPLFKVRPSSDNRAATRDGDGSRFSPAVFIVRLWTLDAQGRHYAIRLSAASRPTAQSPRCPARLLVPFSLGISAWRRALVVLQTSACRRQGLGADHHSARTGQRCVAVNNGPVLHAIEPFDPSERHPARHKGAPRNARRSKGAHTDPEGEASLRGHMKAEGTEQSGSQSYVPQVEKHDRALKEALDLLRGTITDAAFPPNPKAPVP